MTDAEFQLRQRAREAVRMRYRTEMPLKRRWRRGIVDLSQFARGIYRIEMERACRMSYGTAKITGF